MANSIIPTDWNGDDRELWFVCVPNSRQWRLAFVNAVKALMRGRYWDETTGNVIDTQAIGREIFDSMTTCTELVDAIDRNTEAIKRQQIQTSLSVTCCDQMTEPVPVDPPPEPPPPGTGTNPPPAYPNMSDYQIELCRFANALHYQVLKFLNFLHGLNVVAAILTLIVALLGIIFPDPLTTAIGSVTLASIIGAILVVDGGLQAISSYAEQVKPFWESEQQQFVCYVYLLVGTVETWKQDVLQYIIDTLQQSGVAIPAGMDFDTIYAWLEPFIEWAQVDLWEYGKNLPDHPSPVDCTCGQPENWLWDFEDGLLGNWVDHGNNTTANLLHLRCKPDSASGDKWTSISANGMATYQGKPTGDYVATNFQFSFRFVDPNTNMTGFELSVDHIDDNGLRTTVFNTFNDTYSSDVWHQESFSVPNTILRRSLDCFEVIMNRHGQDWSDGKWCDVDDITVTIQ